MKRQIQAVISAMLLSMLVVGCARNVSSTTYEGGEVGVASRAYPGVILSKRAVSIDNNSGAGGLAGTVAGAAAGSRIGGGGTGAILGAVGGAVVGGVTGHAVDSAVNHHQGYEYIIHLKKGSTVSVVQASDQQFNVKQRVFVIYGAKTRIVPDTTS